MLCLLVLGYLEIRENLKRNLKLLNLDGRGDTGGHKGLVGTLSVGVNDSAMYTAIRFEAHGGGGVWEKG